MKIAQVAPLTESVPPTLYGGTERVVSYLTEELVGQGHDVTLFASGDSRTRAKLVPFVKRALRIAHLADPDGERHKSMAKRVALSADAFDIIHFHTLTEQLPYIRGFADKTLTTVHLNPDFGHIALLRDGSPEIPFVAISDSGRNAMPLANWVATIHHGIPERLYRLQEKPRGYLAFLGRIAKEKRPDLAIAIADRAGVPLRMAAKVDPTDVFYFKKHIEPLLANPLIDYIGEISDTDKQEFLGGAVALVFPIDWSEPFGLVMIEAMACGTPVIAFDRGSVSEIVEDGVTGFIVDNVDQAVDAVKKVDRLDRGHIRRRFEARFTADRMARDYLAVYRRLLRSRTLESADHVSDIRGSERRGMRLRDGSERL